ncbi:MAG: hypothetical protein DRI48_05755 [Chloroflexi bacterium]|nr:MAG: hypothetical protein DRI48_05755 [Chloroflexota bacterium]
MPDLLETELKTILEICREAQIPVFVIGAFSVRAYNCLLRVSQDLDLAINSEHWPHLKQVLLKQVILLALRIYGSRPRKQRIKT